MRCWQHAADPYGKAVITAAIDARRLGLESILSRPLLELAARGYLTESQQATASAGWLDDALAYATTPLRGAATALRPIAAGMGRVAGYIVADYLLQYGKGVRRTARLPTSAWDAFTEHHDDVNDLWRLAANMFNRGLYLHAEAAYRKLAAIGDTRAAGRLAELLVTQGRFDDAEAAQQLAFCAEERRADREFNGLLARYSPDALRARADAGNSDAMGVLAKVLARDGQFDELRTRADAGEWHAGFRLGELLAKSGRLDELRTRMESGDRNAAFWCASVLADQGHTEEAITALRPFADLNDPAYHTADARPWVYLVQLLYQQGHLDELRARAEAGDSFAADWIAKYKRIQDLRREAAAGNASAAVHYAELLVEEKQVDEAVELLKPLADSGEGLAAQYLADLLAEHEQIDDLQSRADTGDIAAVEKLAQLRDHQRLNAEEQTRARIVQQLARSGNVDNLCSYVDANPDDLMASMHLAWLLQDTGDVTELRARADDFGDAAHALAELLAAQGRADELISELCAGNRSALSAWAGLLNARGEHERAERLRIFGVNADGSIASK